MRKLYLLAAFATLAASSFAQSLSLLKDINPAMVSVGSYPNNFTPLGTNVFFAANTIQNGQELWKTDGTIAGTTMVMEIQPGTGSSAPQFITPLNGVLYFSADDGT